jgi:hypothetical protein
LEDALAAMQVPFPELTVLWLASYGETVPVIPDSFLDGSAPRLRLFFLEGILFQGLPKLLLSATHLVNLSFGSTVFLIPGTFHPKRLSLSSPCCPALNNLPLDSNPLNLALTAKRDVLIHRGVLSSQLSHLLISKGLSNI